MVHKHQQGFGFNPQVIFLSEVGRSIVLIPQLSIPFCVQVLTLDTVQPCNFLGPMGYYQICCKQRVKKGAWMFQDMLLSSAIAMRTHWASTLDGGRQMEHSWGLLIIPAKIMLTCQQSADSKICKWAQFRTEKPPIWVQLNPKPEDLWTKWVNPILRHWILLRNIIVEKGNWYTVYYSINHFTLQTCVFLSEKQVYNDFFTKWLPQLNSLS